MKKYIAGVGAFAFPVIVFAQGITNTLTNIKGWIDTLIPLLMTLAVVVFFWGLVKYIASASDEAAKENGKNLMIWGMIALFVMVAFWGIIGYFQTSLGVTGQVQTANTPNPVNPF